MFLVELTGISKEYKTNTSKLKTLALSNVNLQITEGEIVCVLGPSGSGKTTLLRIIAGIETETSGEIKIKNTLVNNLNTQKRNIGFVFQNIDAILPHLTVYDNVAFPLSLKIRRESKKTNLLDVSTILNQVDLIRKKRNYPHELSGGEKQRVALARSLVYRPDLLLLDEPLSSLDNILKKEITDLIKNLHSEYKTTILYVTHDEREAIEIADRIVVMSQGKILQIGKTEEIIENPFNSEVAKIIGGWNIITGRFHIDKNQNYLVINNQNFVLPLTGCYANKDADIGLPTSGLEIVNNNTSTDEDFLFLPCSIGRVIIFHSKAIVEIILGVQRFKVETFHVPDIKIATYLKIDLKQIKIWQ